MYLQYMVSFIIISCAHSLQCSHDYKIVGDQKQSVYSFQDIIENDSSIKSVPVQKTVYKVELPTYHTGNGCFIGRQSRWVSFEDREKITQLIEGKIDENSLFPLQLYFYNEEGNVYDDSIRWVGSYQKKCIEQIAVDNKRKQAEDHELSRVSRLRTMSGSLFGFRGSKK